MIAAGPAQRSIAVVDGGSFVLPYDFQLVKALSERGARVVFHGSRTRYNGEFLEAMSALAGVTVVSAGVSGTVSPRWRGVPAYAWLLLRLLRHRAAFDAVNVQFSAFWPLELPVLCLLRHKLLFTVHNAVPHGFAGQQHRPTRWIASMAQSLVFVSEATRDDFMQRYGEGFRAKASVVPHGLLPTAPELGPLAYALREPPQSLVFWSRVKPYKGVELLVPLARSPRVRARSLSLAVYGAWDPQLHPLRRELRDLDVHIHDTYLDRDALQALLAKEAVFLLPYRDASQSGALYSLLNHGCRFICADVGDMGAFMRRFGLEGLLLKDRSVDAVLACLDHLQAHEEDVTQAFQKAQDACRWDRLIEQHGQPYGIS